MEIGQSQGVGNGALLSEIRQGDDDAVDSLTTFLEKLGTMPDLIAGFQCAVLALLRSQRHNVDASGSEYAQHLFPSTLRQVIRKEATITDDQAHGHFWI